MQLQELNDNFTETNIKLLLCVACLYPDNLFLTFDKQKLFLLASFFHGFFFFFVVKIESPLWLTWNYL